MDLNKKKMNTEFTIPKDIEKDAVKYMENVLQNLKDNGVLENVDSAALTMLARNYSMFIKASKQLEKDGLTVISDRGNLSPHPAIKIANDAQTQAMKVMAEFGLTAKARTKLKLDKTDEDSPLEAFIKKDKQ